MQNTLNALNRILTTLTPPARAMYQIISLIR
ncbi:hypothetical protein [Salmonella phage SD-2_S15]|nr:hypothetical protein [Salmonella phage SD-2_S15]WPK19144.1 hypothetical protein [Salmonella phage SD-6_S16]WPK20840.1 hypothetical protein [Salmonella phage SD-15_S21]